MIISKLTGGLGNQMFQYATGRRLALHLSTDLKLDLSWFSENTSDTKRHYGLKAFNIDAQLATPSEVLKLKGRQGTFLEKVVYSRLPFLPHLPSHYYFEKNSLAFYPEVLKLQDNFYLEGFFNYLAYFEDKEEIIKQDFTLKAKLDVYHTKILNHIRSTTSIAMHIRRADYVTNKNYVTYFNILKLAYFKKALTLITKKSPASTVFVFSDDPSWAKENLTFIKKPVFVEPDDGTKSYQDIFLMSKCHHNIISNSTFSWWGAYLNSNNSKLVVAPKTWFQTKDVDMQGRMPDSWLKL